MAEFQARDRFEQGDGGVVRAMDVSIVIVSYNTRELTLACLQSVFDETVGLSFEVIVVDNASRDDSPDAIRSRFPQVNLLSNSRNVGFAAAVNQAVARARGQFLLLLNPDTVILDQAIRRLHRFALDHPANGIYGGLTLFADLSLNPASCAGRPTPWSQLCRTLGLSALFPNSRIFNSEAYGGWRRNHVREVDIVQGSFLLTPRSVWDRMEGLDPAFFMYGEESDFCLRAVRAGYRPIVTPHARIIHHGGASETVRADKVVRLLAARRLLIQRHWGFGWKSIGRILLLSWVALRCVGFALGKAVGLKGAETHYQTWRSVWHRRAEWDTSRPTWGRGAVSASPANESNPETCNGQ